MIWRVGVMGYNTRRDAVLITLVALQAELRRFGFEAAPNAGVDAALAYYEENK